MLKHFFLFCLLLAVKISVAQDSLPLPDTSNNNPLITLPLITPVDSAYKESIPLFVTNDMIFIARSDYAAPSFLHHHPYFRFTDPVRYSITIKHWEGKEAIFYSMITLLIFFALIRNNFYRYIQDLFKIFFRTTVKQRQIKDQLVQSPLPSLLLNLFFLLSIGMFLALALQYYKLALQFNFWLLYFYCAIALVAVYGVKFLTLKFFGWVFQVSDTIDGYIFIVFAINKIIGIVLLPFLIILAFTNGLIIQVAFSLSIVVVTGLFAYRFFLSYLSIHRQVRISFFHFLLYLTAFEILPLLLINKLMFRFLMETS